eukprot:1594619-Rhodomonas_salina.2
MAAPVTETTSLEKLRGHQSAREGCIRQGEEQKGGRKEKEREREREERERAKARERKGGGEKEGTLCRSCQTGRYSAMIKPRNVGPACLTCPSRPSFCHLLSPCVPSSDVSVSSPYFPSSSFPFAAGEALQGLA